jgi:hypothetical protein
MVLGYSRLYLYPSCFEWQCESCYKPQHAMTIVRIDILVMCMLGSNAQNKIFLFFCYGNSIDFLVGPSLEITSCFEAALQFEVSLHFM